MSAHARLMDLPLKDAGIGCLTTTRGRRVHFLAADKALA